MSSWGLFATTDRALLSRGLAGLLSNKLGPLIACYLLGKYTLYVKLQAEGVIYGAPENPFFPAWLYLVNPLYVDFALTGLLIAGSRLALMIAVPLSFLLVLHPNTFGFQHYVMSSYMFLWLAVRDEENGSVWFGRVTLSFLYMAATIGKATPGWISGQHYGTYLTHLHQHPYLILAGEFAFGIAFLLPFFVGIALPVCIVFGMIYSISWGIFDAVGPILGMLLTFVIYHETASSPVSVTLPDNAAGDAVAKAFTWLELPNITTTVHGDKLRAVDESGEAFNLAAVAALVARVPVLSVLRPVLQPQRLLTYR